MCRKNIYRSITRFSGNLESGFNDPSNFFSRFLTWAFFLGHYNLIQFSSDVLEDVVISHFASLGLLGNTVPTFNFQSIFPIRSLPIVVHRGPRVCMNCRILWIIRYIYRIRSWRVYFNYLKLTFNSEYILKKGGVGYLTDNITKGIRLHFSNELLFLWFERSIFIYYDARTISSNDIAFGTWRTTHRCPPLPQPFDDEYLLFLQHSQIESWSNEFELGLMRWPSLNIVVVGFYTHVIGDQNFSSLNWLREILHALRKEETKKPCPSTPAWRIAQSNRWGEIYKSQLSTQARQ